MKTKSFTIHGIDGRVTVAETESKKEILVSVQDPQGVATARLDAEQFSELMTLDSFGDGLKVNKE